MSKNGKRLNEYDTFKKALKQVLQVSHSEMQQRIEEDKKTRASKPRPSISGRASSAKD